MNSWKQILLGSLLVAAWMGSSCQKEHSHGDGEPGHGDHGHHEEDHGHGDHGEGHDHGDHGDTAHGAHGDDHGDTGHGDHGDHHGEAGHGAHGGDHGHHGGHGSDTERGGGDVVTLFTEKSELFMEYSGLVVGMETAFAAHLTRLSDYSPVTEGELVLILETPGTDSIIILEDKPAHPGIFRPVITPQKEGTYRLHLRFSGPQVSDTFVVDNVPVTAKPLPPEEEEEDGSISFLKEQAWKIPFQVKRVEKIELHEALTVYGEVVPVSGNQVMVTAPFSGKILKEHNASLPRLGQRVSKGDTLVRIISPQNVSGGWSAYTQTQETLKLAKANYERLKRLHAQNAIPLAELQKAEMEYNVLKSANTPYAVTAPLSGTITEVQIVVGKQANVGDPLVEIINHSKVWIQCQVPSDKVTAIQMVSKGHVQGSDGEKLAEGKLVSVGNKIDRESKTLPVVLEASNAKKNLVVGSPVTVELILNQSDSSLAIPESAIYEEGGNYVVFVQLGGESFEKRNVVTGIKSSGLVQIKRGLEAGEYVVTQGGYQVKMASLSSAVPAHGHAH